MLFTRAEFCCIIFFEVKFMKYLTARATKNSDRQSLDFLSINNCGAFIETAKPLVTSRPDGRMDYQLIYVAKGIIEITDGGDNLVAEGGSIIIFRPYEAQIYRTEAGSTFFWIHFSGTATNEMLSFFTKRMYKVGTFIEFEEFCQNSVKEFAAQKTAYDLYCTGQLISLIAATAQKIEAADTDLRSVLAAAVLDMHTNFTAWRTNEEYARMCGLSKSHFIRLFHKAFGIPPQKYRTNVAMHEAKHLLKSKSVSVTAEILGYSDVFYFSRLFKKNVGISPRNYKEN